MGMLLPLLVHNCFYRSDKRYAAIVLVEPTAYSWYSCDEDARSHDDYKAYTVYPNGSKN